jgi:glycosyltransferase involved in cell wall biosynthesis
MFGAVPFNLIFGGGETQLINTMDALKKLDVDVDYYDFWDKDLECDILHIFGCHHWMYHWAHLAKKKGIKIALSTIAYTPEKMTLKRKLFDKVEPLLPVDTTYGMARKLIQISDILLPNSYEEEKYLINMLNAKNKEIKVIPNATDIRYKYSNPEPFKEKYQVSDYVLCVGKIEPRKNQLLLVKALENTNIPLVIIGSYIPNNRDYYKEVVDIIDKNENMMHIEYLPFDSELLSSAYAGAKTHVLLGKNETPGIVNLEAGLAGANLVVGDCSPVREYLKDFAEYCDLESSADIKEKIYKAYNKEKSNELKLFIEQNYTWDRVGKMTLDAYKSIL